MTESVEPPIYANSVRISMSPFDVLMEFGYRGPKEGPDEFSVLTRIVMSPAHAKTMIPILARMIADYETKAGPIPAPGFENPPPSLEPPQE